MKYLSYKGPPSERKNGKQREGDLLRCGSVYCFLCYFLLYVNYTLTILVSLDFNLRIKVDNVPVDLLLYVT